MGAALVALVFGLFDFSGGGASRHGVTGRDLAGRRPSPATALVVGSMRMRLQR